MIKNDAPILTQTVRWGEDYVSRALNFKFAGIIPAGIYHGFEVIPAGEMSVAIINGEDYPRSIAIVERDGYSLTITMEDQGIVQIPAPGNWSICIEAFYAPTKQGYQRIVAREKAEAHHVVLASVFLNEENALTISYAERQNAISPTEALSLACLRQMELTARHIRTTDRLTRLELAFLEGVPVSEGLSPSGYTTISGARVAPVTIVRGRTEAPANAALGLRLTEIEQGD